MDPRQVIAELKRRGVSQVAAIYSAAAWALLQVADIVVPLLGLPDQVLRLVLIVAACGFPVSIALAWIYDLKPDQGRESDAQANQLAFSPLSRVRMLEFALILFLVCLVGALYVDRLSLLAGLEKGFDPSAQTPPAVTDNSVAVLPFVSMTDDVENAYFSDGLAEEILNLLAKMRSLDVASRTASFRFKDSDIEFREIARKLGVKHILEGSVRRDGNQIRVTAQLIDASTGYHLWSETYDRTFKGIFSIQDDIARKVAQVLEGLIAEDHRQPRRIPTENMEAYDLYLKGQEHLRRPAGGDALDTAESFFQQAIALDPQFAAAHAGLCATYIEQYAISKKTDYFESAEKFCHRTLTLDNDTSDAHGALGKLYLHSGQYARATEEFERSIAIDELYLDAYYGLADSLRARNLLSESEATLRTAIELKPAEWRSYLELGSFLFTTGRATEAIPFYLQAIELVPDNPRGYNSLGSAYYMIGDYEAAAASWRRSIALAPSAFAYSNTGSSYYFLGRFDDAIPMYEEAVNLAPDDHELWGNLGDALRAAGQEQAAVERYEQAMALALGLLEVNPSDAVVTATLAYYQANTGHLEDAPKSADRAGVLAPDDMFVHYFIALTRCRLADYDAALVAISRAVDLGYPPGLLEIDPGLHSLFDKPKFRHLLASADRR